MMRNSMNVTVTMALLGWALAGLAAEAPATQADPAVQTTHVNKERPRDLDSPGAEPTPRPSPARATPGDRLELDTTVVTGNRELPKVLYIVPWKKAGIGDLPAQPFNTLLDEVLMPVDRDVFRREVTYYDALSSHAVTPRAAGEASAGPADGSEK